MSPPGGQRQWEQQGLLLNDANLYRKPCLHLQQFNVAGLAIAYMCQDLY